MLHGTTKSKVTKLAISNCYGTFRFEHSFLLIRTLSLLIHGNEANVMCTDETLSKENASDSIDDMLLNGKNSRWRLAQALRRLE